MEFNQALSYGTGFNLAMVSQPPTYLHHPIPTPLNHQQMLMSHGIPAQQQNYFPTDNSMITPREAADTSEDWSEVLGILIELRSQFRNLKWYGELNKRAFTKILKKLDKKVGTNQQQTFIQSRILPLDFSNDMEINRDLHVINDLLNQIFPKVKSLQKNSKNDSSTLCNNSDDSFSPLDVVSQVIAKDDSQSLMNELISIYRSAVLIPTRTLVGLLNKSALAQSFKCIDAILNIIPTLGDSADISSRNFFHHHVIALGKSYKKSVEDADTTHLDLNSLMTKSLEIEVAVPPEPNKRLLGAFGPDGVNSNDSPSSLVYILEKLPVHLRPSLLQRDNYKRTPLHYAAQYGR